MDIGVQSSTWSWNHIVATALVLLVTHSGATVIYRLYLHPLAKYPGPRLAAATYWYDFYWEVRKRGQFAFQIQRLHQQYGPVVRINPNEIHISDPDYFPEFLQRRGLDKYSNRLALPGAFAGTLPDSLHRKRRGAVNSFFLKTAIVTKMPIYYDHMEKLCDKLAKSAQTGEVVQLDLLFVALTMDIISVTAFRKSYDYLEHIDLAARWKEILTQGAQSGALSRHFKTAFQLMNMLPFALLKVIAKPLAGRLTWQHMAKERVHEVMRERELIAAGRAPRRTDFDRTVFDVIFDSNLPPEELSVDRLASEGTLLLVAGTETTTRTLSIIFTHLLVPSATPTLRRLRAELATVMPRPTDPLPPFAQLEGLPYLTGVVKEGLRLQGGLTLRLDRVSKEPTRYKNWTFPPGAHLSMSSVDVLTHDGVFPCPEEFHPKRWICRADGTSIGDDDDDLSPEDVAAGRLKSNAELDKYMVAFSRGSRQCAGMWVAWAELYACVAAVVRRFELELWETDLSDVAWRHDFVMAFPKLDSKGVRVRVKGLCAV